MLPKPEKDLASHLVAGNVNLALVKRCLGLRSITRAMPYVGTSDGLAAEAARAKAASLEGARAIEQGARQPNRGQSIER
jgi:hypothetical protein